MDPASVLLLLVVGIIYAWVIYNLPTLMAGLKRTVRLRRAAPLTPSLPLNIPMISVVVPVKNEEKVVERFIKSFLKLDYPAEKKELLLIEDGSTDSTPKICAKYAEEYPGLIKFFHRETSVGKPNALNFAQKMALGELLAFFDADSVPEPGILLKAASCFEDDSVVAVQGMNDSLNAKFNVLTRLVSYEEAAWLKLYIMGKDALRLFVPLTGSCMFIRASTLKAVGGWDEGSVAEDIELAARLLKHGFSVNYRPEVRSRGETPSKLGELVKQRTRWFRGYMESSFKYWSLLLKLSRKSLDAEATLAGPFMMNLCLISYLFAILSVFFPFHVGGLWSAILAFSAVLFTLLVLFVLGTALVILEKPYRLRNLVWIPLIYAYWILQTVMALRALLQIATGRPRVWRKTEKTGILIEDITSIQQVRESSMTRVSSR